jgi:hypothetical protein
MKGKEWCNVTLEEAIQDYLANGGEVTKLRAMKPKAAQRRRGKGRWKDAQAHRPGSGLLS